MTDKLKPCPFCGGESKYIEKLNPKIICTRCEAQIIGVRSMIKSKGYKKYLYYLWNKRVGEQK